MNLNLVQIVGRICHTPEVKTLENGTVIANFSVATNKVWKNQAGEKQESTEFHNVVSFGKQADTIAQYFKGGDEIYIQGSLKTSNWEDKNGGAKRYKTEIVVDKFEFGQKAAKNIDKNYGEQKEATPASTTPATVVEEEPATVSPDQVPF